MGVVSITSYKNKNVRRRFALSSFKTIRHTFVVNTVFNPKDRIDKIKPLYLGRKVKDKIFTKLQKSKGRDKLVKPLGTPSPNRR